MKIGFFTETYLPSLNGVSVSLAYEKKKLEKLGHQVYVFAPKIPGEYHDDDTITRLSSMKVLNSEPVQKVVLPVPNSTLRKTFRVGLDVVHAHGGGFFSFLGYQLALAKGYPFVLTYHTYLEKYSHYFFLKNEAVTSRVAVNGSKVVCNLADIVIVPSKKMKTILHKYGVTKKIVVVPNPIDTEKFRQVEKGFFKKHLGIAEDKIILLTVCRLGKEKNLDFLIKSFKKISTKAPEAIFVIVGDGPEKDHLAALVKKLKLTDKVILTGFLAAEQMPEVYSASDIFLFASTSETQGMIIPEAAACGLPLVVVKDEAYSEALKNGVNGYETAGNMNDFSEKVLELVENKDKRLAFGQASQEIIAENFDPEKIIKDLLAVYHEAIQIRKEAPRVSNRLQSSFKSFTGLFRYVRELNNKLGF